MEKSVSTIKRAQKESLYLREIANLFLELTRETTLFKDLFINRTELSESGSVCVVYFYSSLGRAEFDRVFADLKLYKPSLRKALSKKISSRYTPEIIFKFDDQLKKQLAIEELIERVKIDDARFTE